jgi:DNA-binding NarL/FixJ family response regulator
MRRGHCPCLILLDLNMPRLDGPSLLQGRMKRHSCAARVVVVTGMTNARAIAHAMQADGYVRSAARTDLFR